MSNQCSSWSGEWGTARLSSERNLQSTTSLCNGFWDEEHVRAETPDEKRVRYLDSELCEVSEPEYWQLLHHESSSTSSSESESSPDDPNGGLTPALRGYSEARQAALHCPELSMVLKKLSYVVTNKLLIDTMIQSTCLLWFDGEWFRSYMCGYVFLWAYARMAKPGWAFKWATMTDWLGADCPVDFLNVWFPAHWSPIVLRELHEREVKYRGKHRLRFDDPAMASDTARLTAQRRDAVKGRELHFHLGAMDEEKNLPTLIGKLKIDWLDFPVDDILQQFTTLKEGILRGVFKQKAARAWFGCRAEKAQVTVLLPGSCSLRSSHRTPEWVVWKSGLHASQLAEKLQHWQDADGSCASQHLSPAPQVHQGQAHVALFETRLASPSYTYVYWVARDTQLRRNQRQTVCQPWTEWQYPGYSVKGEMALAGPLAMAWPAWLYVATSWCTCSPCPDHYGKDPCGVSGKPSGWTSWDCKTFSRSGEEEMEDQRWDLSIERSRTFWTSHARNGGCHICRFASGSVRDYYGRDYITEENIWERRWVGLVRNVSPFHLRRSHVFGGWFFGFWGVFWCCFVFVCLFVASLTSEIFWVVCE